MTQFQNIYEENVPKAEEEVRKDRGAFKGFEVKNIYTDDGGEFKGVCHHYLENAKPKNEEGSITNINHVAFAPSSGTKRRYGVVERFNRTFKEKYVACAKNMNKLKKTAYFKDSIPQILEEYNFIDDHRAIKEFMTKYKEKGNHFFTPDKEDSAKAPIQMLMRLKEGQFIKWKEEQSKKVNIIQKDRIDALKSGNVEKVKYFKGLFSSSKRKGKRGEAATNIEDQFMKSGTGNLSSAVPLVGAYRYNVKGTNRKKQPGKSFVIGIQGDCYRMT